MKVIVLTSVRDPQNPTELYIQADKIVSWSRVGENTEVSVETVPFPFIVSDSPDDILTKVQEALNGKLR